MQSSQERGEPLRRTSGQSAARHNRGSTAPRDRRRRPRPHAARGRCPRARRGRPSHRLARMLGRTYPMFAPCTCGWPSARWCAPYQARSTLAARPSAGSTVPSTISMPRSNSDMHLGEPIDRHPAVGVGAREPGVLRRSPAIASAAVAARRRAPPTRRAVHVTAATCGKAGDDVGRARRGSRRARRRRGRARVGRVVQRGDRAVRSSTGSRRFRPARPRPAPSRRCAGSRRSRTMPVSTATDRPVAVQTSSRKSSSTWLDHAVAVADAALVHRVCGVRMVRRGVAPVAGDEHAVGGRGCPTPARRARRDRGSSSRPRTARRGRTCRPATRRGIAPRSTSRRSARRRAASDVCSTARCRDVPGDDLVAARRELLR